MLLNEKFVEVDNNRIRYLDSASNKRPMVLVHGLGASADRWEFVAPRLSKHFRLIIPDLLGFGFSDKPVADYTTSFLADFLDVFLDSIDIAEHHIIGTSMGGYIAVEYASRPGSRAHSMILVSPAGIMKTATPALNTYIMAALYPNKEIAKSAFQSMAAPGNRVNPRVIDGFVRRMKMPNAKMAFMSALLGLKNAPRITPILKTISIPTMVVWGVSDPVIPIRYAAEFVSSIRGCRYTKMYSCGHAPYAEEPDEFCDAVMDFLKA